MKRRLFLSIRAKLTISFFIVFLIPMAAVFWLLSQRVQEAFDTLARPRMNNARTAIAADFGSAMDTTRLQALTLAQNGRLGELVHLSALDGFQYEINPIIHEVNALGRTTSLDFIRIAGPDQIVAAYPDRSVFLQPVAQPFDANLQDVFEGRIKVTISKVSVEEGSGLAVVVYAPVRYQGEFENLIDAPVDAVLIAGSFVDQEYLGKIHDLSTAQILFYSGRRFTAAAPAVQAPPSLGGGFLKKIEATPDYIEVRRLAGTEYMFGGLPLRSPDTSVPAGYLVIGVSREELHAVMANMQENAFKVALMGAGLCLVLAFGVSLGITRPIAALGRSARLIGEGRFLDAKNKVRTRDEVGLLGQAMNIMIDGLKSYSEKLAMSERVAAWRDIARRIAHEIKNPLSPIQLSVENMKALYEQDPKEFKAIFPEAVETVLEEVDKLRRLANEFSEFARMPKPEFESVDLAEVIENVVKLHARAAQNITVNYAAGLQEGMRVRADRDQLNRVFTNLVKNAIEAMPEGGTLTVLLRRVNDEIFVVIEDTGVGMDTDQLARIFTPYYTTKPRGSGLGLAMVQRILQDHGAGFDVYSEKGKGAKFIIAFKELSQDSPGFGGPDHA